MGRLAVALVVAAWAVPISIFVNHVVPEPYMDEIFHVPQAQRYCKGDFSTWDPMITTLPGLYYVSLAYVASLFPGMWWSGLAASFPDLCSTAILRSVNIALSIICSLLFYEIFIQLRPDVHTKRATAWALVLALYPLHWFFTFLFYTDVGSTTAVMAMYLACLKRSYWLSALLGCLSIMLRQTNVVWTVFIACIGVMDYVEEFGSRNISIGLKTDAFVEATSESIAVKQKLGQTNLRKRQNVSSKEIASNTVIGGDLHYSCESADAGVVWELQILAYRLWHNKWVILVNFFPFLILLFAFATFVVYNGSIVVGAKEAHVVSPHFAQIMYFGLASATAMAPVYFNLGQAMALYQSLRKGRGKYIIHCVSTLMATLISIRFFSLAHPYLLADNRHYPFYIWRKVIQAHWLMKYLLIPFYLYSWWSILYALGKSQNKIWLSAFFFAVAGVLVPAPLIEFRYYTVPFYFIILHVRIEHDSTWFLIGMQYIIVDLITMSLFLFRPFHWDHESGTQRFIW